MDFAVPSTLDADTVAELLAAAGFTLIGKHPHSINFQHASGEPVRLAFDPMFDPMIARAELLTLGDLQIPVVTEQDLIEMKRRAAADPARRWSKALRDQADIALLEGDVPERDEGW